MNNHQLVCKVEGTLLQVKSMAKIALDNTNYKLSGYDEPFINHCDTGNLLWATGDLLEDAYKELLNIDLKGDEKNA